MSAMPLPFALRGVYSELAIIAAIYADIKHTTLSPVMTVFT